MKKPILDQLKRGQICGIVSIGGTRKMAAHYVGCCTRTITNTANRDPEFKRQLEQAQLGPEITFLKTLHDAGQEKWQAAKWALQHIYPDRYARKPATMPVADVQDLISDLLAAIVKVVPDSAIRAAIRRAVRRLTRQAVRKARNQHPRRHGK